MSAGSARVPEVPAGLGSSAPCVMSLQRRALGLAVRETFEVPCSVVS